MCWPLAGTAQTTAAYNQVPTAQDRVIATDDHARADGIRAAQDGSNAAEDHAEHLMSPHANTADVIAGGSDLWRLPGRDPKVVTLAEWIDGCLYPKSAEPETSISCVAQGSRAAARRYRRIAGLRSWESEATTLGATTGLTVVAISAGHAAKDTLNAWTGASLVPLIVDEVSAPGPRARLYTVAATAMTLMTSRAETLDAVAGQVGEVLQGGDGQLRNQIEAACSARELAEVDKAVTAAGGRSPKSSYTKAAGRLTDMLLARCADLRQTAARLEAAAMLWRFDQTQSARALGTDTITLDDAITRLDRQTLTPSRSAVTAVFGAALALPGKLTGTAAPAEFTGRNLPVFTSTFTFNLARAPDVELPAPVGAPILAPDDIRTKLSSAKVSELNELGTALNSGLVAAHYFKAINERSVLSISPGSLDQPVMLSAPTRP